MIRVSATTDVSASPESAWDLYADVAGSADWVPFTEAIVSIDGPPGVGQVYRERTRLLGIRGEQTWEIVEWDPPRRQAQRSRDLGADSRLVLEFQPIDGGTRITQTSEIRSRAIPPFRWLHEALFGAVARHGLRGAVEAARLRLEAARLEAGSTGRSESRR
jgi:hypothetical protein